MTDKASTHASPARMLIRALESVILPIVNAHVPGLRTASMFRDGDGLTLEPEAQQLVSSFEKFITALLRSQVVGEGTTKKSEKATINTSASDANLSITRGSPSQITAGQSKISKEVLIQAHHRVFNKMPIRLLAFKSDGSGIELVERSTVFSRISKAMEADIHIKTNAGNIEEFISRHTKYAILSHTWLRDLPGEVTYADWKSRELDHGSTGYRKLANFCRTAAIDHGITYGWMDTICINKDSSAELDESIRSMYAWYTDASICITYLAETMALERMRSDPWFTRGWTLQELLAPQSIEFYGANWQKLPTYVDNGNQPSWIGNEIYLATDITEQDRELFRKNRYDIPISKKMKWAANRQVTREEDVAYSLMGIFDVSLSIAYGEGTERAFVRLLKEVMGLPSVSTLDILNWGSGFNAWLGTSSAISSLICSSPKPYLAGSNLGIYWPTPSIPMTLTHLGLHVSILLMPAISVDSTHPKDRLLQPIGQFYASADVEFLLPQQTLWGINSTPTHYEVMDKDHIFLEDSSGWDQYGMVTSRFRIIFGLLNFVDNGDSVVLPAIHDSSLPYNIAPSINHSYGFVLCFIMKSGKLQRLLTLRAVTLDIKPHGYTFSLGSGYKVLKSELKEHGMKLRTLYL